MSRRKRRRTRVRIVWTLVVVLAVAAGVLVFQERITDGIKEKAAGAIIDQVLSQAGGLLPENIRGTVLEVYENMDEEDKDKVKKIIAEEIDSGTAQDVKEYVENGDMKGLEQYAENNLSPENSNALQDLYDKYKIP